jgi:hypothetical protein
MGPEAGAVCEALTGVPNVLMGSRLGVATEGLRLWPNPLPPPTHLGLQGLASGTLMFFFFFFF